MQIFGVKPKTTNRDPFDWRTDTFSIHITRPDNAIKVTMLKVAGKNPIYAEIATFILKQSELENIRLIETVEKHKN